MTLFRCMVFFLHSFLQHLNQMTRDDCPFEFQLRIFHEHFIHSFPPFINCLQHLLSSCCLFIVKSIPTCINCTRNDVIVPIYSILITVIGTHTVPPGCQWGKQMPFHTVGPSIHGLLPIHTGNCCTAFNFSSLFWRIPSCLTHCNVQVKALLRTKFNFYNSLVQFFNCLSANNFFWDRTASHSNTLPFYQLFHLTCSDLPLFLE